MRLKIAVLLLPMFAVLASFACVDTASAQQNTGGCTTQQIGGTSRHELRCRNGLTAITATGAQYSVLDRNRDRNADAVRLNSGAMLFDVEQPQTGPSIEVIAPQAIAAVRGTQWAVDAQASRTSVFVVRGTVNVRRPSGGENVTLNAGDGVDVDTSGDPLVVRQWPASRVSALLARFGQ